MPFSTSVERLTWEISPFACEVHEKEYWLWSAALPEAFLAHCSEKGSDLIEGEEASLQQSSVPYSFWKETILESTSESFWALDCDFRLLYANQAYLERFERLTGMHFNVGDRVIDTESQAPGQLYYRSLYERALKGETVKTIEHFPHAHGISYIDHQLKPIFQEGKVVGVTGFAADFTQLKNFERELEQLNQTFMYVKTPIMLLNAEMDGFLRVNPHASTLFQVQEGTCFQQFAQQFTDDRALLKLRDRLRTGQSASGYVVLETRGDQRFMDVSIQRLQHEEEVWFVWFIRDITDARQQLEQLSRQNDLLHDLAWFHAHRLREPSRKSSLC
ncbi:transcriptional regulator [Nitritalea halalkaliphila LW7]|uniref:Transcriptional regulator n=1 Tax=Nitritalea halalkaliphila LW7 TaxID=1189621 RepID=I5C373_9BACT|nr:PAS domain-containing protein [Nitritalea halalkaliphila]EIM76275.1 transcriptional regulator [Nitritalea halalkaliphila LW7]